MFAKVKKGDMLWKGKPCSIQFSKSREYAQFCSNQASSSSNFFACL